MALTTTEREAIAYWQSEHRLASQELAYYVTQYGKSYLQRMREDHIACSTEHILAGAKCAQAKGAFAYSQIVLIRDWLR